MNYLALTPSMTAIIEISDDELLTLHACIRETLEALSNEAELRIRVGVETSSVEELMHQVRAVRSAMGRHIRQAESDD